MNKKIKLLWDFRGEDAKETAVHHTKHLEEFAILENFKFHKIDFSKNNPMFYSAYIVIDENDLTTFKNALKPHRGKIV